VNFEWDKSGKLRGKPDKIIILDGLTAGLIRFLKAHPDWKLA